MNPSSKVIALTAFLALISSPPSNPGNREMDNSKATSLFETLWEKGSLKINPETGKLIVDEGLLEDLESIGAITVAGPAKGDISSGICY